MTTRPAAASDLLLDPLIEFDSVATTWRQERSYRVGKTLCKVGLTLGLCGTLLDFFFVSYFVLVSNLALLGGCLLSLWLTKKSEATERYFFWIPAYAGFWLMTSVSSWETGGLNSPFLGLHLALLFLFGLLVRSQIQPLIVAGFTGANLLGWTIIDLVLRVLPTPIVPPIYASVVLLLLILGLLACAFIFLNTERELMKEIALHYDHLLQTRASLAKEESASAAKSTFIANMSRELRTPLGAILGFADLLLDKKSLDGESVDSLQTIRRNGLQLSKIVNDILDISKVEAGKVEIERSIFCPRDLVHNVETLLKLTAESKKLRLLTRDRGAIPDRLVGDPLRISQILTNMVGNAIKYSEVGHVEISLGYDSQTMNLEISVHDTGRGMTEAEQEMLFKPFSQVDTSMSREYGGTGLGLALSRKLARLLGGDLVLTSSSRNVGSVFTLLVPAEVAPAKSPVSPEATAPARASDLAGKRILIVDDTADNQKMVSRFLHAAGATTACANDGFQGVQEALTGQYDVVLMDVQMPVLDGLRATILLRQQGFRRPVIALTAHAMKEDRERCLASGCNAYLSKPVDRQLLIRTISEITQALSLNFAALTGERTPAEINA